MLRSPHQIPRPRISPLCGGAFLAASAILPLHAQPAPASAPATEQPAPPEPIFYIREYRVAGSTKLSPIEIQDIVYPYLGPARTAEDVEKARLALEAAFREKGYQTASVLIPQQDPRFGLIRLEVVEGKVGRLRVNGAKWYLPSKIKAGAPSIAEGSVPNLTETQKEIIALNRSADRRVVPALRPGIVPGTVDIDLNVEDKLPLHGSIELNNRYSADTTKLRLNGALSYGNMFQLGHTLGGSFQVAPENKDDSLVFSGYYLARINEGLSLMVQGSKQDSDISTLGGAAVVGAGSVFGLRAILDLPMAAKLYQNLTLGIDYRDMDETTLATGSALDTGIEYYPLSLSYAASRLGENDYTEFNLTATLHLRGLGDDDSRYGNKRYGARASFFHLRGDVSHTHDFKGGSQLFGKLQGQLADGALINNEQMSGGGLGNARGYLEATALGDNGIFGTVEYRSPSFVGTEDENGKWRNEWRLHAFLEGGVLGIYDALPGQNSTETFASFGFGTRFRYAEHFNGSLDIAFPLLEQTNADVLDPFLTFRGWADF
jgi:hemolysin activation/secretion protein